MNLSTPIKIKINLCVLVLLAALLLSGCGRIQNPRFTGGDENAPSDVTLKVDVADQDSLNMGQSAELTISLEQKGEAVEGATIEVEGNMNHAGMEPLLVNAEEVGSGQYRAGLNWTMGGGWFVTVRATLPDGTTVEQVVDGLQVDSQ
ncbi:MAG: FixH family protein [Ardenticatenaceae bacterium]